jgi:hypothetical protein
MAQPKQIFGRIAAPAFAALVILALMLSGI